MSALSIPARAVLAYSLKGPSHRGKWKVVSTLVDTFNLHPEGRFLVERAGRKWALCPRDYPHRDLFWYGVKDRWALHHVTHLLPQNGVVFDVGANFGYYSVVLAERAS